MTQEPLIPATVRSELRAKFETNARNTREIYTVLQERKQGSRLGEVCQDYAEAMLDKMEELARSKDLEYVMKDISIETRATADVCFWRAWRRQFGSGPTYGTYWLPTVDVPFPPLPEREAPKEPIGFRPPPPLNLTLLDVERIVNAAVASAVAASTAQAMTTDEIQALVAAAVAAAVSRPEDTTVDIEHVNAEGVVKKQIVRTRRRNP